MNGVTFGIHTGYGVTVHCLDPGTVSEVQVKKFDGEHWEDFIEGSGITELSMEP